MLVDWSVRLELHQHLPGYEPDALAVKLRTKNGATVRRRGGDDASCANADWQSGPHTVALKLAAPAGLAPATSAFEARRSVY